ncbi:MAG: DUF763 domain-containing protein, partial [Thermoplasmata archaeon]|nr:DUF763 domain-containing protein [Thermoplasmata archaeon]
MKRTADLPLHGGKAPPWLFKRMVALAKGITEVMVYEYGQKSFLERISDPFWFQSLSCVLGFDWHSSGTTTVTTGALKEAIDPAELGIAVAGGKGKASLKTPLEILGLGNNLGLNDSKLLEFQRISRLSAKVDNALVQDSFKLYHHTFFLTEKGDWAVIRQGMNFPYARRYHWFDAPELINEPHKAILGHRFSDPVLNLTAEESRKNRSMELELVKEGPQRLERLYNEVDGLVGKRGKARREGQTTLDAWGAGEREVGMDPGLSPKAVERLKQVDHRLMMPMHINWDAVREAYEFAPSNYEELIAIKGIGPSTVRSLALIGELIYGTEASWRDPVKFSFAVGGKDGVPYPVDRRTMDESIEIIGQGIQKAKAGDKD